MSPKAEQEHQKQVTLSEEALMLIKLTQMNVRLMFINSK